MEEEPNISKDHTENTAEDPFGEEQSSPRKRENLEKTLGGASGIPVAPEFGDATENIAAEVADDLETDAPSQRTLIDRRIVFISALSILLGVACGYMAQLLQNLIGMITAALFYGRFAFEAAPLFDRHFGWWGIAVPILGSIVVGLMAKYGSEGIRGDGIPEVMEGILTNESRISPKLMILKPLSAAVVIGTGGPFGAEGPVIATGGAMGSVLGQLIRTTAMERKTLLGAGAAGGIAAFFGTPVAAVLMAMEVLLFEFRPRSLIPVSLASATAMAVRIMLVGADPIFKLPNIGHVNITQLAFYTVVGALVGLGSIYVTHLVYFLEDAFEKLPVHWMWWPAIGSVVVGVVGFFIPQTLGAGYENIDHLMSGQIIGWAAVILGTFKLISWAVALSSGTSGGTIAPLFTIGGAMGVIVCGVGMTLFPNLGLDVRIAALVGMGAIFSGSTRAMLTSIVFALEATMRPYGLLPLLSGCAAAYMVSALLMENTIMTEKTSRHGVHVPTEYVADYLDLMHVKDVQTTDVAVLNINQTIQEVRQWMSESHASSHHQGFPVLDDNKQLLGVITYRNLMDPNLQPNQSIAQLISRLPITVYHNDSLRIAADRMVREDVGRLPVVTREAPGRVVGIISRGDILSAHRQRIREANVKVRNIEIRRALQKMVIRGRRRGK